VIAAVCGLFLSESMTEMPAYVVFLMSGAGFLTALLMHEIFLRRRENRALSGAIEDALVELDDVRHANIGLLQDLAMAREEMATLCDVVEGAADGANRTLVREVKVLQQQLSHMAARGSKKREATGTADAAGRPGTLQPRREPPFLTLPEAVTGDRDDGDDALPIPPATSDDDIFEATREALEANRIDLYLQPIVSLPQRKVRFYEAFSRLRRANGSVLAPNQYLGPAKELGLISIVDNLVLFRCVQLVRRLKMKRVDVCCFVNISANTLNDSDFLGQFAEFLAGSPNLANHLVLEFAQADVAAFSTEVIEQLTRLSRRGFRFSVDQVEHLELDVMALDRIGFRFVKVPASLLMADPAQSGASIDPRDLKKMLGRAEIDLIADHIEDERDVVEILDFDVDFGQGYLFGEPRQPRDEPQEAA
jgi:cyclic-di-GMP phosphodiesterase TipF (flagellum assembly factor)